MKLPNVLIVNLVNHSTTSETISTTVIKKYLGGQGINTYLLAKYLKEAKIDPLSAENILVFGSTPLANSDYACSSGYVISTLSPLSHTVYHFSANGVLSLYLKGLGYDYLVLKEASNRPAYMLVQPNNEILFFSAKSFWEESAQTTNQILQKNHPDSLAISTGTAGVNMVRFATLSPSSQMPNVMARGGLGAVLGSKNLKAIVFAKPSQKTSVVPQNLSPVFQKYETKICSITIPPQESSKRHYRRYLRYMDIVDVFAQNARTLISEEMLFKWLERIFLNCRVKPVATPSCPVFSTIQYGYSVEGENQQDLQEAPLPNFEDVYALGLNLGLENPEDSFLLNRLAQKLGIDPIEMGYTLSSFIDWRTHNLIDASETRHTLRWGDVHTYQQIMQQTAHQEGIGKKLGQGLYLLSKSYSGEVARNTFLLNRQALRYSNNYLQTLLYLVHPSCVDLHRDIPYPLFFPHYRQTYEQIFQMEATPEILNPRLSDGKAKWIWWLENYLAVLRSLGICHEPIFAEASIPPFSYEMLAEAFSLLTEIESTKELLEQMGKRILLLQHQINATCGEVVLQLHLPSYIPKDKQIHWQSLVEEYYHIRGCTSAGVPKSLEMQKYGLDTRSLQRC